jgi:Holliday junction resolvase RusA-like endonuclease
MAEFVVTASWTRAQRQAAQDGYFHTAKPDADNIEKSVLDGLMPLKGDPEFCLFDDAQVAELLTRKFYGVEERTLVTIERLEPPTRTTLL